MILEMLRKYRRFPRPRERWRDVFCSAERARNIRVKSVSYWPYFSQLQPVSGALARRLAALRQRMLDNTLLSATGRICAELKRLAEASDDGVIRPLPVFAELAQRVQSTRETVSRTVSRLERRGVVQRTDGGLAVVAMHRLEELIY